MNKVQVIGVGFVKCGTSTLRSRLNSHSQVMMPNRSNMEISHFFRRSTTDTALHRWFNMQPGGVRAEWTSGYLCQREKPLGRIYKYNPEAKILVAIRNPVDRLQSHWDMHVKKNRHTRIMNRFGATSLMGLLRMELEGTISWGHCYLNHGKYATHLSRLFKLYPKERVHIMRFEDIVERDQDCFDRMCDFLEVGKEKVAFGIHKNRGLKKYILDEQERQFVKDTMREEMMRTEDMLDMALTGWY